MPRNGSRTAVVVQALLFGAAHFGGFPSGFTGVAMAGAWGFVLGVLRLRSGGILVPYGVHVAADAVIGTLAVLILR
ncbi:CPBP family intramembrane glutamic endopeptidase [Streptomyces sp. NPDC017179]|uniref:CPBP family intramembrane glutamic endopeptidase n=1 Tax=Streptomyces sp. NPDC017179 TaxID=3364979 RepID=UPI0037A26269